MKIELYNIKFLKEIFLRQYLIQLDTNEKKVISYSDDLITVFYRKLAYNNVECSKFSSGSSIIIYILVET